MSLRLPALAKLVLFSCTIQALVACDLVSPTQTAEGSLPPSDPATMPSELGEQLGSAADQQVSETGSFTILEFGPNNVQAGQLFNVQPSGLSAVWVKVDRPLAEQSYIQLNGTRLGGNPKGDRIGAQVPAELTEIPGTLTLEVVQIIDGQEVTSAPVDFVVK